MRQVSCQVSVRVDRASDDDCELTVAEAAELLGLAPRTIRRPGWDRLLAPVVRLVKVRQSRRYSRATIERVLATQARIAAELANVKRDTEAP